MEEVLRQLAMDSDSDMELSLLFSVYVCHVLGSELKKSKIMIMSGLKGFVY